MRGGPLFLCALAIAWSGFALPALATTGKGCLHVRNIASGDKLWLRVAPQLTSKILLGLTPDGPAIIHLDGACVPKSQAYARRWCPVSVYADDGHLQGYVKARFVRDSECP